MTVRRNKNENESNTIVNGIATVVDVFVGDGCWGCVPLFPKLN